MSRRKTTTKPTAVESSELAVNENNESQLSVFDYSGYSEDFKLKSYERKARIKANEQVATKAFYDIAQDVKAQHDEMNNYQDWLKWCRLELEYTDESMCNKLKLIGENLQDYNPVKMPKSFNGLLSLARVLRDSDEETKEEILTAVEEKTEKKGKALTEKEIKELPQVKELEERLKAEKEAKEKAEKEALNAQQTELKLIAQLAVANSEKESLKTTSENQNKQIQELNSVISAKEKELQRIENKEAELNKRKAEIDQEVETKAKTKLKPELEEIEKQKEALKNQEKELKAELKKQKAILDELTNQKHFFTGGLEWLKAIDNFNWLFTERALGISVVATIDNLKNLPDFKNLTEEEKVIFERRFNANLTAFNKNKEAWSNAVNQIELILNQMRLELNISDSKAVDVEVLNAQKIL